MCSNSPLPLGSKIEVRLEIVRVVDGDTIVVLFDGAERAVRLIGNDALESSENKRREGILKNHAPMLNKSSSSA